MNLYSSFYKNIIILNNLTIKDILEKQIIHNYNLNFSNKQIKSCELGIICKMCISKHLLNITKLDLSMNLIDSQDLSYLIYYLKDFGSNFISLDLSNNINIINGNDKNYNGINDLLYYLKMNTNLQYVNIDNNMLSENILNKIMHSTMINRIITKRNQLPQLLQQQQQQQQQQSGQQQQQQQQHHHQQQHQQQYTDIFESYLSTLILQKAKPDPSSHQQMLHWKPTINMIDKKFVIQNKLLEVEVDVDLSSSSSSLNDEKDEIYLISREFKKL